MKNIVAIITIVLLILMAMMVPIVFNKIFDGRMNQQIRYIEDGKYNIVSSEEKNVRKRMEEIAGSMLGNSENVARIPIYINDTLYNRIAKEYRQWRKLINKNIEFFGTQIYLNKDITIYDYISLYWDYDSDISFYVCKAVVGESVKKQKYTITMYIDKETYKILYMQLENHILQQKVMKFWESNEENKYSKYQLSQKREKKVDEFLKNYYHIPDDGFQRENGLIYIAKIFKELEWNIWETPSAGVGIGISVLDEVVLDDYTGNAIYSSIGSDY